MTALPCFTALRRWQPRFLVGRIGRLASAIGLALSSVSSGQTIGSQQRVDAGTMVRCTETAAACAPTNPNTAVAAWNYDTPGSTIGVAVTTNGGVNWAEHTTLISGLPAGAFDPTAASDVRTGELWVGGYYQGSPSGLWVARWNAAANSFFPADLYPGPTGIAHPVMLGAGPQPGLPNTTRLYFAYGDGWLTYSDNLGAAGTWQPPIHVIYPGQNLGAHGPLPRVGPNGELYVVTWDEQLGIWLNRILPGSTPFQFEPPILITQRLDTWSWAAFHNQRFPGWYRVPARAFLAVHPTNGTLYCVYFDTTRRICHVPPEGGTVCNYDVDVWFTKSPAEPGQVPGDPNTWTPPKIINGPDNVPYDQFFSWIECDTAGKLHVLYYDNRGSGQYDDWQGAANISAYYAYSADDGTIWHEQQLCPLWNDYFQGFNGDYLGMAASSTRVYPVYMATTGPGGTQPPPNQDIYTNVIVWQP
ncbi:MAG: hypothetical protein HZB38_11910 [Planctomycetes bacterium]|nr:hypothetical protein [Planctomycetota bacterium]